ncbi:MAG: double-strand break repair helicase AddA [Paracoccaceae bacterium]
MTIDDASIAQRLAADPAASTWLSANAGSGKTRVLTDRVARLLLNGVDPQHILCLTYTKAAASEMQNRLFTLLGKWALKADVDLRKALSELGETGPIDAARLAQARRLFARAIETPGGLRIQTIHSFCASLLRRFPLEAGVTPQFTEMDDRAAELLRAEVVERIAEGPDAPALDALAAEYTGDDLGQLTRALIDDKESFAAPVTRDDCLGWFGLAPGTTEDAILASVFDGGEPALLRALVPLLMSSDKVTDTRAGERLAAIVPTVPSPGAFLALSDLLLFGDGAKVPRGAKIGSFPTKGTQARLGPHLDALNDLMSRVEDAFPRYRAFNAARRSHALHRFAAAFLPAYDSRKAARGWLDFDDLILKTRDLLTDPRVAAWVLYRLDGGLDHILVDEAQDTSPTQWQVIAALAQEMAAGIGAQDDRLRTIFVVGDQKQSIYSFQGADPAEFDRMRRHFADRLAPPGPGLANRALEFSFRSSDAILRLVDHTFAAWRDPQGPQPDMRHRAVFDTKAGRVDLWPVVEPSGNPEDLDWFDTADRPGDTHHSTRLARAIAEAIADMIGSAAVPDRDAPGGWRPLRAGDVMILVQRRSALFHEIIRACKARNLPVAGADRLKLGGELAVRDIGALLSFLATPEDDLSLAAALRSPLFGWDEGALHDLAAGRAEPYLWRALQSRKAEFPETLSTLEALRNAADFLRPYDLIERVLIRHDGRRRLLARLGPEAEDGIDALLSQALAYERTDVPSLTGFLTWLQTDDVEVKRQLDSAGDQIRVMTVHGAKGLESPVVILPDTAKRNAPRDADILHLAGGQAVWRSPAADQPAAMKEAAAAARQRQEEERLRLLYVAMTRAESWLIVCAAGDVGDAGQSWYRLIEDGLTHAGAVTADQPTGPGLHFAPLGWRAGVPGTASDAPPPAVALPAWASARAAPAPRPAGPRAPSDLGGPKALPGEIAPTGDDDPLRRGRQIHLLLEHLPLVPRDGWTDLARDLLTVGEDAVTLAEADALCADAARVLEAPDLAPLFAADALAEVAITAHLPEIGARIHGAVDRLLIDGARVLAVDYKTNRIVPDTPAQVPEGLMRQMGAYAAALAQIYPGRRVEVAILWTALPRLMPLPHDMVRSALARTGTS